MKTKVRVTALLVLIAIIALSGCKEGDDTDWDTWQQEVMERQKGGVTVEDVNRQATAEPLEIGGRNETE